MSELLTVPDEHLASLAASLAASVGGGATPTAAVGWAAATEPPSPRAATAPSPHAPTLAASVVVGIVMDLDIAGATAVTRKLRGLLGHCRDQSPAVGTGGPAASAPVVAIGSAERALEAGLWPTDAVFLRPLLVDEVVRFLAESTRFATRGRGSERGTSARPERGVDDAGWGAGGAKAVRSTPPPLAATSENPPPVARGPGASVRPPGRRTSYRPGAAAGQRDDELLAMVGADDDAELQELSADQVGPGGEPIRLGSDIERLLESAARAAPVSMAAGGATRPSGEGGKRLNDQSLRALDDLLRADDPAAVERKVVGTQGAVVPTAVGIDRHATGLTAPGGEHSAARGGQEGGTEHGWSVTNLLQHGLPPAPAADPSAPSLPTGEREPGADTIAHALASEPSASESVDRAQLATDPPAPGPYRTAATDATAMPTDAAAHGPPDAVELVRRAASPAVPAPRTGARPTTSRPFAPAPRPTASSPRFSEPPPSEPRTFARERWTAGSPPPESGALGQSVATLEPRLPTPLADDRGALARKLDSARDEGATDSLSTMGRVIALRSSGVVVCERDGPGAAARPAPDPGDGGPAVPGPPCRWIVVRDGDIITASSDVPGETVLDFLIERGELSREAIRPHEPRLPPAGRHAVAALIAYGFLAQDELWGVLRAHAEWLLTRALREESSCCRLVPEVPEQLRGEPAVFGGAAGVEVFLEAIRRVVSPASATERLGGRRARFFAGDNAPLLAEAALTPAVVEAVHAARGATLEELVARFGDGFASVVLGLVALKVLQPEPRRTGPAAPPAPEDGLDPLDAAAVRERVRARLALVHEGDYFMLLGVSPDATEYDIRRAFVELRRRFEPSTLLTAATADLHDEVTLIIDVLEEAYEVLRDPWRRTRYRKALLATSIG